MFTAWKLLVQIQCGPPALLALALAGCAATRATDAERASAYLAPRGETRTTGVASFVETERGLRVVVELFDAPAGMHGVHVHSLERCAEINGPGQHFNPDRRRHGDAEGAGHAGDLGNVEVDANGLGRLEVIAPGLELGRGERSVVGLTIAVTEARDDLVSQPCGDSGPVIACGEIRLDRDD